MNNNVSRDELLLHSIFSIMLPCTHNKQSCSQRCVKQLLEQYATAPSPNQSVYGGLSAYRLQKDYSGQPTCDWITQTQEKHVAELIISGYASDHCCGIFVTRHVNSIIYLCTVPFRLSMFCS